MTAIEIGLLGVLQPKFNMSEAVLPGRKLRSILAILAYRAGTEVRRDELIEELDLIRSTGNAANALHAHITRLRRWLSCHCVEANVLESATSGYRLNVERSAVDAHMFVDQVERALALAPAAPSVVATMLEDALDLWRGDALVDVVNGPIGTIAADELHQMRSAAREMLLDAWIELGRDNKVIVNARRFIVDDPLNERLRAQLITALHRVGRHAEAIESYNQAQCVLRDELGVEPGRVLRASVGGALGAAIRPSAPVGELRRVRERLLIGSR